MQPLLHGWLFSPYLRAARIALKEKGVGYRLNELTPVSLASEEGRALTPFGRIPVFEHDGLRLFETQAILAYIDDAFSGPALRPANPAGRAEVTMLLALAAHHFYPSGVMGVFFQEVYVPANGGRADPSVVEAALADARPFLSFVENRLNAGAVVGSDFTLADGLIGAMMHNFALAPSGVERLAAFPRLANWLGRIADRPSFRSTEVPVPLFGL